MNKGVNASVGEIIGVLNSDDFYAANDVLRTVSEAFEDTNCDACYGDLVYVAQDNVDSVTRRWVAGAFDRRKFYSGWMPPHPTFFVRRQIYEKYGLFNLELGTAAYYEVMLRFLLKYEVNATYIPKTLVRMRTGGVSNASLTNRLRANRMDREAWRINGLSPHFWTLYAKPLRKIGQWIFHS